MYNIGLVQTNEQNNDTYKKQFPQLTHQLHPLTKEEVLNVADKMDALIIEESSVLDLKHTCELILELRRHFKALIWVVSKNQTKTNKLVYLQLGADGVLDEEDERDVSLLQLTNLLKRIKGEAPSTINKNGIEQRKEEKVPIQLIATNLSVVLKGKVEVALTKLEFEIISYLAEHTGKALTYEEIYKNIWNEEFGDNTSGNKQYRVSNMIFHLRKKLEVNSARPEYIKTVRSKGYMLMV
ncbi:winged helix-turn-helix domain-containing protein [Enterococcus rotai]|uniref:winged helix-turn-helix domain-containing protein n=1 Tax=Enterococcus rotai TaxID=118060 RepID=UPI0035C6B698